MPLDIRLKYLSYSSDQTLHECPRKFELYKLGVGREIEETEDETGTFGFGHMIGTGIQDLLCGKSLEQTIWEASRSWTLDIMYIDTKRNKSFFLGILALKKFNALLIAGFLSDFELVYLPSGEPAVELGFRILMPHGFIYRGFVDIVLRHKSTGAVVVLELKTSSSSSVVEESFMNSDQGIGYSVVLHSLCPGIQSYNVLYIIYKTKEMEYVPVQYPKTSHQLAKWLAARALEVEKILLYEKYGTFPMHGESCVGKYFKKCGYLGACHTNLDRFIKPVTQEEIDIRESKKPIHFTVTYQELVETQLQLSKSADNKETNYMPSEEDQLL